MKVSEEEIEPISGKLNNFTAEYTQCDQVDFLEDDLAYDMILDSFDDI